jgi:hypothetical protein
MPILAKRSLGEEKIFLKNGHIRTISLIKWDF